MPALPGGIPTHLEQIVRQALRKFPADAVAFTEASCVARRRCCGLVLATPPSGPRPVELQKGQVLHSPYMPCAARRTIPPARQAGPGRHTPFSYRRPCPRQPGPRLPSTWPTPGAASAPVPAVFPAIGFAMVLVLLSLTRFFGSYFEKSGCALNIIRLLHHRWSKRSSRGALGIHKSSHRGHSPCPAVCRMRCRFSSMVVS